jgi:hypothetical protein
MPAEPKAAPPPRGAPTDAELLTQVRAWSVLQFGCPPLLVTVELVDGTQHTIATRGHTPDFRSVLWDGVTYYFNEAQAAVVRTLWLAIPVGGDVGRRALLGASGSDSKDVRDVFRLNAARDMHPAWHTMIVEGRTKGAYRLAN